MKKETLQVRGLKLFSSVFASLMGILAFSLSAQAQSTKNYATVAVSYSNGSGQTINVPDFANASDGNESTFATLNSETFLVFSSGSYVEIAFPADVPQGSTIYIPVQDDTVQGLLSVLAGGTLGNLLTDLLGNQHLEVNIKDNAGNSIVNYSSAGNGNRVFAQGRFNFVKDASKQTYITFKPAPGINVRRIRVTAETGGILGETYQLKVQDAFYLSGAYDPCNPFVTTSIDATGVTLTLLDNNGLPVKNAERAIDSDTTNFSTFGYGLATVALGSTFSQDFYFSNLSKPGDHIKLKLRFPSSLLSANVLNTITIAAYRNDTLVSSNSLSSLLSAQLLALLTINVNNNVPTTLQINPDASPAQNLQYDRVRITYTQLANASLLQFIELYGVDRVPAAPTVSVPTAASCPGTAMTLKVTNVMPGISYKWYNGAGAVVSTDTTYSITVPANGVTASYWVTSSNCPNKESIKTQVDVTGTNANCVAFSPVAYLQGAFNGTENKQVTPEWLTVLAANATSQPYNTPAFGYTGTESVAASLFTATAANTDIVDWMLLELKDSAGTMIDRKAVLVLENGNVTNLDKTQPVMMKSNAGRFHLTVRHRNHLGLSSNLVNFTGGNNLFNFTTATDADLFGDANAYVVLNGKTAMRGGNANSNFHTRFNGSANDRDAILFFLGGNEAGTIFNVYTPVDVNMDGMVRFNGAANDRDVLLFNLGGSEYITLFEQRK